MKYLLIIWGICVCISGLILIKDLKKFRRYLAKPENEMWVLMFNSFMNGRYGSLIRKFMWVIGVILGVYFIWISPMYILTDIIAFGVKGIRFIAGRKNLEKPSSDNVIQFEEKILTNEELSEIEMVDTTNVNSEKNG